MKRRPIMPHTLQGAFADVLAMRDAILADDEHDTEFRATDAGRRAFELRETARAAAEQGDFRVALPLIQQAVALLPQDKDSVALAALQHDLAKTLLDDPMGHPHRRQLARDLLEPAVASEARRRYPRRWAITASLLATCSRELAKREDDDTRRALLLDRAESLFRQAAEAAEACRSWWDAFGYWFNLGNLMNQRDEPAAALAYYERSHECARPFEKSAELRAKPDLTRLLTSLGQLLKARGRRDDVKRARRLLKQAVQLAHPEAAHVARLVLADWLVDDGKPERAITMLGAVEFEPLPLAHLDRAVRLFERTGLAEESLRQLRRLVQLSLAERASTIADLPADRVARRLQQRALVLAEALVRNGYVLDAFLTLDNTSALRFAEATHAYTVRLRDPISRGLQRRCDASGMTAAKLEEVLDRLQALPPEHWRELIEQSADILAGLDSSWAETVVAALREATTGDAVNLTPIEHARDRAALNALRARELLAKREPGLSLTSGPLEDELDRAELRGLLASAPEQVFLRIALDRSGRMFVISVFLDGDDVATRHTVIALPGELLELLDQREREPGDADLAARLTTHLAQLDLTPVLPDGRLRSAVLLPSALFARLPLAALGPPGTRLLDRFEAVTWLPSLFPLRVRQDSHRPRHGIVTVAPAESGGTVLHALALRRTLPDEQRLAHQAATIRAVIAHARAADVVCCYAHGEYAHGGELHPDDDRPPGPILYLAERERLTLTSLSDQWEGVERVELWCCETGVNLPMDPMGVVVDEAFGFDYEFLRVGARSAIGSLHSVPEFVAAVIVDRFRERLLDGASATVALADAQRDWIDRALPRLVELLRGDPDGGFVRFAAERGFALPPGPSEDADRCEQLWSCPMTWASFRFVGVADRRPLAAWDAAWERPLTDAEDRKVEALLSRPERSQEVERYPPDSTVE